MKVLKQGNLELINTEYSSLSFTGLVHMSTQFDNLPNPPFPFYLLKFTSLNTKYLY